MSHDDLFGRLGDSIREQEAPLAWRLRPQTIEDLVGQPHLFGPSGTLLGMVRHHLRSSIFYGPPGTGKTTTARILARSQNMAYLALSAVESGIQEIRKIAEQARDRWGMEKRGTVLFLDEIHRFSKSQQDVLLPYVEDGTFVLIGATTENPWVALNSALISRCLLVEFKALDQGDIVRILERAWTRHETWWGKSATIDQDVFAIISGRVFGDARLALTLLERLTVLADEASTTHIDRDLLEKVWADSAHYHDRQGDQHYDLISAFIKSIRGSDPDAALYWFGRLLAGGEDPRFIVRRLLVHAAEDIGLADPNGLVVAQAAWTALEAVGLPEARIPMAEAVLYLSTAPKSHSVVDALAKMDQAVARWPNAPVPDRIRDRHYNPRITEPYRYPHHAPGHFVPDSHLPAELEGIKIYDPSDQGEEIHRRTRVEKWRQARREGRK